jgi:hypothetical protein
MDEIDTAKLSAELTELMKDLRCDEPDWGPLEKVMPLKWCAGFMWMGQVGEIHLYKHGFTRHYLNVDASGNAYRYLGPSNRYVPMDLDEAIEAVFEGLDQMRETRSSPYDDAAVQHKHEALAKLGWTTVNVSPDGVSVTEPTPSSNRSKTRPRRANGQARRRA